MSMDGNIINRINMLSLFKGLGFIVLLVLMGFLVERVGIHELINESWVDTRITGNGFTGQILFIIVGVIALSLGTPRQLISFVAGYAFGLSLGFFLALIATSTACFFVFIFSRFFARNIVQRRFSNKLKKADEFFSNNTFSTVLLVRLLPVGNNLLTSLVAGASSVRLLIFLLASTIGYIPQTLIFTLAGSGITVESSIRIATSLILFCLSSVLGFYLYKKYKFSRNMELLTETSS